MKIICTILLILSVGSCANGKETVYRGCTPANNVIKSFLRIPLTDSVDFIRWKISIHHNKYNLRCNYGIGKQNTNGFVNGGKWIELNGPLTRDGHYYYLRADNKRLGVVELNTNLIHFLDDNKNPMIGTGGWSYTLNAEKSVLTDQVNLVSKDVVLKDSMVFQGRTPCGDFSINPPNPKCIKMKWLIILYSKPGKNEPTTYLVNRSNLMPREYPGKRGTWKVTKGKDGRIIYELQPENESTPTYLLKLDDNIVAFTDKKGNLLVGDEDFSFTLSRRQ